MPMWDLLRAMTHIGVKDNGGIVEKPLNVCNPLSHRTWGRLCWPGSRVKYEVRLSGRTCLK